MKRPQPEMGFLHLSGDSLFTVAVPQLSVVVFLSVASLSVPSRLDSCTCHLAARLPYDAIHGFGSW